jgi:hypothetical protein
MVRNNVTTIKWATQIIGLAIGIFTIVKKTCGGTQSGKKKRASLKANQRQCASLFLILFFVWLIIRYNKIKAVTQRRQYEKLTIRKTSETWLYWAMAEAVRRYLLKPWH